MPYSNIIHARLQRYNIQTLDDEENALKEILQEIALYALSTTDFFAKALFQGGTSLRILYQLPRFSEDLDFILKHPDSSFGWDVYIEKIIVAFELFGIKPTITDRSNTTKAVRQLFLKDNSVGKVINLQFGNNPQKKLLIKLEIDTNPPNGSVEEIKYLDFPLDCVIMSQDLPSNFAGKCHALLCRPYVKGRDWFDFSWYVGQGSPVNLQFLSAALNQTGPWAGQNLIITNSWLIEQLTNKIKVIDWNKAKLEVERFINLDYHKTLGLWSKEFFISRLQKLSTYLKASLLEEEEIRD